MRAAAAGGSVIDPTVVEQLVAANTRPRQTPLSTLTPRELEVLGEMAQGKSNAAIAASLVLSERAVEKHTNSLFAVLGLSEERDVNRRVKAVLLARWRDGPGVLHTPAMATPTAQVRVLVVDDQRPFRLAAAAVLRRTPGFALVGEAASGEEALAVLASLRPDLVLMDITMPGTGGIEATRRVLLAAPATVVLLCSTDERGDLPAGATTSGAAAYLHKEELTPAVLTRLWQDAAVTRPAAPAPG